MNKYVTTAYQMSVKSVGMIQRSNILKCNIKKIIILLFT